MKKPLLLLVACAVVGFASPESAFAQATTGAPAQGTTSGTAAAPGEDPKEATDAALAWKNQKDAAAKTTTGKELIVKFPGTKAADFVAGTTFTDKTFSDAQKTEIARTYYETYTAGNLPGQYLEYSLGVWATTEKDPAKQVELAKLYLQKYPTGTFQKYIEPIILGRRGEGFQNAIKAGNIAEAEKLANEAFAANQNEFFYAYTLADFALQDMTQKGAQSAHIEKSGAWIDRALAFVEGGKTPPTIKDPAEWEKNKPQLLNTLYRAKGYRDYLIAAKKGPSATPADFAGAITNLQKAIATNDKDILSFYFIGQACNAQYAGLAQK